MLGETNLQVLLKSMRPKLRSDEYVFVCVAHDAMDKLVELNPLAMVREEEGMTLVITRQSAEMAGIEFDSVFSCITLTVHSSLDAVGLTAAFSNKLAQHDISANVIAGYYHDHIFVQATKAEQALAALQEFSAAPN